MENQKQNKEDIKKETTTPDPTEGVQPKADGMLKDLYEENNRTEKLQKEGRELLNSQKEFFARQKLGGVTLAGQAPVNKTQDDLDNEEAEERVKAFS